MGLGVSVSGGVWMCGCGFVPQIWPDSLELCTLNLNAKEFRGSDVGIVE